MKWSLKIGRFSGIDVRMHVTFLLLVGWVALLYWRQGQSVSAAFTGVAFILAIFLCVILHEFGHALAARRYVIKTRDIILLPIGGVAGGGRVRLMSDQVAGFARHCVSRSTSPPNE